MTKYKKAGIELPLATADELVFAHGSGNRELLKAEIVALRYVGWTFESIAVPLGVSRERVRQLFNEVPDWERPTKIAEASADGFVAPLRPVHEYSIKEPRVYKTPSEAGLARLLELQPKAQQVRANSPRYRAEGEEFTALLVEEHKTGVPVYQLAKALGVTNAAIRSRLIRYGYLKSASTAKAYTPIRDANRV